MSKKVLNNKILRVTMIGILIIPTILLGIFTTNANIVNIDTNGFLSFDAHAALAVQAGGTFGTGESFNQDAASAISSSGGLPIVSVSYVDGIHIDFGGAYPDLNFTQKQIDQFVKNKTMAEAETIIENNAKDYLEVWVNMANFPVDDPAMQDPPILLPTERIERQRGQDYLVLTIGYFAIHIYDLAMGEGDFITRVSKDPITGVWW